MHTGLRGLCIANTRSETRSPAANCYRANQTASTPLSQRRPNRGTARLRSAQRRHQAVDLADRRLQRQPASQLAMDGDSPHLRRSATRSDLSWRTSVAIRQASQMGQAVPQSQAGQEERKITRLRKLPPPLRSVAENSLCFRHGYLGHCVGRRRPPRRRATLFSSPAHLHDIARKSR